MALTSNSLWRLARRSVFPSAVSVIAGLLLGFPADAFGDDDNRVWANVYEDTDLRDVEEAIPQGSNIELLVGERTDVTNVIERIAARGEIVCLALRGVKVSDDVATAVSRLTLLDKLVINECRCAELSSLEALCSRASTIKIFGPTHLAMQSKKTLASTRLSTLSLWKTDVDPCSFSLGSVKDLRLNVEGRRVDLQTILSAARKVELLLVEGAHFGPRDTPMVGELAALRYVELLKCRLDGELEYGESLKTILLTGCSCERLRVAPRGSSSLSTFSCNDSRGAPDISAVLSAPGDALHFLSLQRNEGAAYTLEELTRIPSLTTLVLDGIAVSPKDFDGLRRLKLSRLGLRNAGLTAKDVQALVDLNTKNLDLSYNAIGDEGCAIIAGSRTIIFLELRKAGISLAGALSATSLQGLKVLNVGDNGFSAEDVELIEQRARASSPRVFVDVEEDDP